jgi:hypothetical protein
MYSVFSFKFPCKLEAPVISGMSFEFYLPNLFTLIFGQGGSLGKISHLTKSRIELSVFWYNSSLSDNRLPVQRFWHECLFVLHNWFWLAYGSCQIVLLNRILTLVDFSFWRHFEEKPDSRIWDFFNMKGLWTIDTELNFVTMLSKEHQTLS